MIRRIGLRGEKQHKVTEILLNLYKIFRSYDAMIAEINPLAITKSGDVLALDAKLDIDDEAINYALEHSAGDHCQFITADSMAMPFNDGTFDAAICNHVYEHVPDPGKLMSEIKRVLKPGGLLLIIDFRRDMPQWLYRLVSALWQTVFLFSAARKGFSESALSAYTRDEVQRILDKSNIRRFKVRTNRMELWVTTE